MSDCRVTKLITNVTCNLIGVGCPDPDPYTGTIPTWAPGDPVPPGSNRNTSGGGGRDSGQRARLISGGESPTW